MHPRILLVEDSSDMMHLLDYVLRNAYHVLKAESGFAALDLLKKHSVQLVLSDVMMPGLDGFQLCQTIKSDISLSHIPVVLLTAKKELDSKVEGLELGADAYMEKPVSLRLLQAQIASLIRNRKNMLGYFSGSPLVHLSSLAYSRADETFISALDNAIVDNLENQSLDVVLLAHSLKMSRSTLYRKIKEISDRSPLEFINLVRLKKAAELLVNGSHRINEVARMTGFSSLSSFTRNFYRQFSQTPSDFVRVKQELRNR